MRISPISTNRYNRKQLNKETNETSSNLMYRNNKTSSASVSTPNEFISFGMNLPQEVLSKAMRETKVNAALKTALAKLGTEARKIEDVFVFTEKSNEQGLLLEKLLPSEEFIKLLDEHEGASFTIGVLERAHSMFPETVRKFCTTPNQARLPYDHLQDSSHKFRMLTLMAKDSEMLKESLRRGSFRDLLNEPRGADFTLEVLENAMPNCPEYVRTFCTTSNKNGLAFEQLQDGSHKLRMFALIASDPYMLKTFIADKSNPLDFLFTLPNSSRKKMLGKIATTINGAREQFKDAQFATRNLPKAFGLEDETESREAVKFLVNMISNPADAGNLLLAEPTPPFTEAVNRGYMDEAFDMLSKVAEISPETYTNIPLGLIPKKVINDERFINLGATIASSEKLSPMETLVVLCNLNKGTDKLTEFILICQKQAKREARILARNAAMEVQGPVSSVNNSVFTEHWRAPEPENPFGESEDSRWAGASEAAEERLRDIQSEFHKTHSYADEGPLY